MLPVNLFRSRAILRQSELDPLDDATKITAPHEWIILTGVVITLFAIIVWLTFGSVERSLSAQGLIVDAGERHTVLSHTVGTVSEVPVQVNSTLAAGDPIARILSSRSDNRLDALWTRVDMLERELERDGPDTMAPTDPESTLPTPADETDQTEDLTRGTITSPLSGTVATLHVTVGQALSVGSPIADLRTGQIDRQEVVTFLPFTEARKLKPEMNARIIVDDFHGKKSISAKVASVSPNSSTPPFWFSRNLAAGNNIMGAAVPQHMVRLIIHQEGDVPLPDSTPCLIEVVMEAASPLTLLASSESTSP